MLYNKRFRNTIINTVFGEVEIDDKGFSTSLKKEEEEVLGMLPNWSVVSNRVEAKDLKKEEPKEEVIEEPKEEEIELDENTIIVGYSKEELELLNVSELKEILDDNKVSYPSNIKKAKLISKVLEIQ